MKQRILSMAFVILGISVGYAEMHAFTLQDGRSLEAEVVGYNAKLGKVELKRPDGKRVKVAPNIFVEADQEFIKDWAKMDGFSNPAFFKVSCKRDLVEKWKEEEDGNISYSDGSVEKETVSETKFERYVYEIALENRNGVALDGMEFEYRVFYEQKVSAGRGGKVRNTEKILPGKIEVGRLSPKAKTVLKTKPVVIYEKEYVGDFTYRGGDPEKEDGDIKGIWLRIRAKSPGGQTVTRNVFEPESIKGKYTWSE